MTYTITGKVVRSGRVFETTVYAQSPAEAFKVFTRNHPRSVFVRFVKVGA